MASSSKSTPAAPVLDPFQVATTSITNGKLISLFAFFFVSVKFQMIVYLLSAREISEKLCRVVLLVFFLNCYRKIAISSSLSPGRGQRLNKELGKNRDNREY